MADDDLIDPLVQVCFEVIGVLTVVGAAHDLSLTQVRLLAILRNHRPTMSQLADHLGLDRSTISGLVDRAAARGLVERVTNPDDRRSARLTITAKGRKLATAGAADIATRLAPLFEPLTDRQQQTLAGLLDRMVPARAG